MFDFEKVAKILALLGILMLVIFVTTALLPLVLGHFVCAVSGSIAGLYLSKM